MPNSGTLTVPLPSTGKQSRRTARALVLASLCAWTFPAIASASTSLPAAGSLSSVTLSLPKQGEISQQAPVNGLSATSSSREAWQGLGQYNAAGSSVAATGYPSWPGGASPAASGTRPVAGSVQGNTLPRARTPLTGQRNPGDPPVLMSADAVRYDERNQVIVAEGNVEITEGERLLLADRIIYDQIKKQVRAEGRVRLLEPTGEVIFADRILLNDELESGVVDQIRVLMSDNSRMAALGARRSSGNRTEMVKAVYSPCELCKEEPGKAPLWQLKAEKIVHDQAAGDVEYYNAFLEVFGIPVLYTPYFTHPDPTVERRSGLLTPGFGYSDTKGFTTQIPYYITFSPDLDMTLTPIIVGSEGGILQGEVRKHFGFGEAEVTASVGYLDRDGDDETLHGHVVAKGDFDLNDTWSTGFNIERASDKSYTREYDLDNRTLLESAAFVKGFRDKSYLGVSSHAYQDLTSDTRQAEVPVVPLDLDASLVSNADSLGGRMSFDLRGFSVLKEEGANSYRISAAGEYTLPMLLGISELTATAGLRGDAFYFEDSTESTVANDTRHGNKERLQPYLAFDWRLPFMRQGKSTVSFIEPVASLRIAPSGSNDDIIPNEDSQAFSVDDSNIMRHNRYSGIDRIEGGSHVSYGINLGYYGEAGKASAFLGQSFRLDEEDNSFDVESGLSRGLSDVVGRFSLAPSEYFSLNYNFRLDASSFKPMRHEVTSSLGSSLLNVNATYSFIDSEADNAGYGKREQISVDMSSRFHENWGVKAGWKRDLTEGYDLSWNMGLNYQNECLLVDANFTRSQYIDNGVQPSDTFMLRLSLKNLGDLENSF